MRDVLSDINGTMNIANDTLIYAKDEVDHDIILQKTFRLLEDRGLN